MVSRVLLCALLLTAPLSAYSVLAHEAIIDSVWQDHLAPLIEKKFTGASEPDLRTARAYGGCIVQDMGYYPFVSEWFSDLAHYVRSGDLVKAMLRLAADRNEYAFALGALAHVAGDGFGHPFINRAVPLTYPKLLGKFGPVVTFNDHRRSHIQTEFGFDVLQIARGNYAPQRYHDFIGFEVSKPALERAFRLTYGIELDDMFLSPDLALGTYRWTVSRLIPRATKAAWALKEPDITKARPGITQQQFLYNLSRGDYEKQWGRRYRKPGIGSRILALLIAVLPKVGPFQALSFRPPTPATEKSFMDGFNLTLERYRAFLQDESLGRFQLENINLDTGRPTRFGQYHLADRTYHRLLAEHAEDRFLKMPPELRAHVSNYYKGAKVLPAKLAALLMAAPEQ